jgi:hypothetical protein
MGNRAWNDVDDNELITYKQGSRSRTSWKTIGQRLRRAPESCRARWLFLKNTRSDLIPGDDEGVQWTILDLDISWKTGFLP